MEALEKFLKRFFNLNDNETRRIAKILLRAMRQQVDTKMRERQGAMGL